MTDPASLGHFDFRCQNTCGRHGKAVAHGIAPTFLLVFYCAIVRRSAFSSIPSMSEPSAAEVRAAMLKANTAATAENAKAAKDAKDNKAAQIQSLAKVLRSCLPPPLKFAAFYQEALLIGSDSRLILSASLEREHLQRLLAAGKAVVEQLKKEGIENVAVEENDKGNGVYFYFDDIAEYGQKGKNTEELNAANNLKSKYGIRSPRQEIQDLLVLNKSSQSHCCTRKLNLRQIVRSSLVCVCVCVCRSRRARRCFQERQNGKWQELNNSSRCNAPEHLLFSVLVLCALFFLCLF